MTNPILSRLRMGMLLVRGGQWSEFRDRLRTAIWSERRFIGLERDLAKQIDAPRSPVKFAIRPARPEDFDTLLAPSEVPAIVELQAQMREWIEAGLPGAHVAAIEGDTPCFVQWLLTAKDNDKIAEVFGPGLPRLDPDTVLLEGAYTPPRYRRLPIMPAAMAAIAALGRAAGARRAIVFVGEDNASMIRAAQLAGFSPHEVQTVRRRLLRRSVTYSHLDAA